MLEQHVSCGYPSDLPGIRSPVTHSAFHTHNAGFRGVMQRADAFGVATCTHDSPETSTMRMKRAYGGY